MAVRPTRRTRWTKVLSYRPPLNLATSLAVALVAGLGLMLASRAAASGAASIRPEARLDARVDVGPSVAGPRTVGVTEREALARWHPDFASRCRDVTMGSSLPNPPTRASPDDPWPVRIDDLVERVARERSVGLPLLAAAAHAGVTICLDDRNEGVLGYFDRTAATIVLHASLSDGEAAVILVHELRHLERALHGFVPSTAMPLGDAATYKQALEADVQAVSALYAWRAADLGDEGPWEAYLGFDRYVDIGLALGDVLLSGGSTVDALDAAFQRWWASPWRVETYRFQALVAHLDAVDRDKRVETTSALSDEDLSTLRVLPNGTPYGATPIPVDVAPSP